MNAKHLRNGWFEELKDGISRIWTATICLDCANERGGRSTGRDCTNWLGKCEFCEDEKSVTSSRSYQWPK